MATPFVPLNGHNTVNDLIDAVNNVYQYYALLGTAAYSDSQESVDDIVADRLLKVGAFGLGGSALESTDLADNYILGSFTKFSGTEAECTTKNLPNIADTPSTANRTYVVLTFIFYSLFSDDLAGHPLTKYLGIFGLAGTLFRSMAKLR